MKTNSSKLYFNAISDSMKNIYLSNLLKQLYFRI